MLEKSKTPKAHRTRRKILEAAYTAFVENGYDETTMRFIAAKAGIAVGGLYHYFPSKEHMVQSFYEKSHREHAQTCQGLLVKNKKLKDRLRVVMRAKIEQSQPFHGLAVALFRVAADPNNPLSPFSADSASTRNNSLTLFKEIVEGCSDVIPKPLKKLLPEYLWMYQMGILLFWIHDKSDGSAKTLKLINRTTEIIQLQLMLMKTPLLGPFQKGLLKTLKEFHPNIGENYEN